MERKIGEIFEYNGEWYQCINTGNCSECAFTGKRCYDFSTKGVDIIGDCTGRTFKKLEKVGEPIEFARGLYFQRYQLADSTAFYEGDTKLFFNAPTKTFVCIEIKQNKEDMEEKNNGNTPLNVLTDKYVNGDICYDDFEKEVKALYSCKEEIKPTLKDFDLEAAKQGKPVCTRNGRKARIICFDTINEINYPIIALIEGFGYETLCYYNEGGKAHLGNTSDLMMLPEKKEGWININKDSGLFKSKEEAKRYCTKDYATVRVEFEI